MMLRPLKNNYAITIFCPMLYKAYSQQICVCVSEYQRMRGTRKLQKLNGLLAISFRRNNE